jgi:hypothetical protein
VGALVTVVGQLARNRFTAGKTPLLPYLLQPPAGAPFYITNKTLTELQMALSGRASVLKVRADVAGFTTRPLLSGSAVLVLELE